MKPFPSTLPKIRLLQSFAMMVVVCTALLLSLLAVNRAFAYPHQDPASPDAPGSIAGVVKDAQGAPLAGIRITLYSRQFRPEWYPVRVVTTTVTGTYKIPVLTTGIYRLGAADAPGHYGPLYYPQSPTVDGATDLPIVGNNLTQINFTLTAAAQITGIVTILNELVPTNGYVTVYTQVDEGWHIVSNYELTHTGHYTAGPLPPGIFRLCAWANPYVELFYGCYGDGTQLEEATDITLTAGETRANVTIVVGRNQYNGTITGTVTADGIGTAGIQVNLLYPYNVLPIAYTLTDANGHYTIGGLNDGDYNLHFFDPAAVYAEVYQNNQRNPFDAGPIQIRQGAIISNINAALVKGGTISGTVHLNNGQPVNTEVFVSYSIGIDSSGNPVWSVHKGTQTDQRGQYVFRRLWPDTYRLCLTGHELPSYECYGSPDAGIAYARDIVIQPGTVITNLDLISGPDFGLYLPRIAR